MGQSFESFDLIQGLKAQHEASKPVPQSDVVETETQPMTIKDYDRSLRVTLQEQMDGPTPPDTAVEVKRMSELLSPALRKGFTQILSSFHERASKHEEHPAREYIDTDEEATQHSIDGWTEMLIQELIEKSGPISYEEQQRIAAEVTMLFEAHARVYNTRSVEQDIREYDTEHPFDASDTKAKNAHDAALMETLQERYPFDETDLAIIAELARLPENPTDEYSARLLIETINKLWEQYNLTQERGRITKIALGYFLAKGVESFSPSLFQNLIANNQFQVHIFFEYLGLNKATELLEAKISMEVEKLEMDLNHQLNEKIANSLFFREFEYIHERTLGELYQALERGKSATVSLIRAVTTEFAPTLSGIAMSLAFLTKISPILGGIGMASVPIMYHVARKQNKQMEKLYTEERTESAKVTNELETMRSGFEEIRSSQHVSEAAANVQSKLDTLDEISYRRSLKNIKFGFLRRLPFEVSEVVAVAVGGVLQSMGTISGGAVLSNMMYTNRLTGPINNLIYMYFDQFARNIQDIKHMEEIFGSYESLDTPDGERERQRTPVSHLNNHTIKVKGLSYKNILGDVNEEFRQGEFVSITGPSGAGKTTLLRNIVGLFKPEHGEVTIGGVPIDQIKKYGDESIYSIMAYSNQRPQMFPELTLRENLLLWTKKEVSDERIIEVLRELKLDTIISRLDEKPKFLSGGELVRVGVARALLKDPKILLLDEPTASLDSHSANEVRGILKSLRTVYQDTTVICVTHDEELVKVGDRSVALKPRTIEES